MITMNLLGPGQRDEERVFVSEVGLVFGFRGFALCHFNLEFREEVPDIADKT
jgi:hypothetical protein